MTYLVSKTGSKVATVYAYFLSGLLCWTPSRKKAERFSLTEARKVAQKEKASFEKE